MPKSSEVIKLFLESVNHNPRLVGWYNPAMEVQVNVSQGDGSLVEGKNNVYQSDQVTYQWFNFRIPRNANSDPINNDFEIRFPLEQHVEAIGLTGWDFVSKKSVRVGFDFDSITSHAVGLNADQLNDLVEKLKTQPDTLLLRSTGGEGFHLYLEFDPENLPTTNNHSEHSALAIACLKELSQRLEFDFTTGVDVAGCVLWIWHRKLLDNNNGLSIIKTNDQYFKVPDNWDQYNDVALQKRTKAKIVGVDEEVESKSAANKNVPLDETHKKIIADLQELYPHYTTVWVHDHHLLQTKTKVLKEYAQRRAASGDPLIGTFETSCEGKEPGKPNCFCFPMANGGFKVLRFGKGAKEHESWETDSSGWTYTYFNYPASFFRTAASYGGIEDDTRGFYFTTAESVKAALQAMGHKVEFPIEFKDRKTVVRPKKDKLVVEIEADKKDDDDIVGWIRKKTKWVKVYNISVLLEQKSDYNDEELDQYIRLAVTQSNVLAGWFLKHEQGRWILVGKDDIKDRLEDIGQDTQSRSLLGHILSRAWIQVNLPFQDEYPGSRQWNRDAAQLNYKIAQDWDFNTSQHPHWDLILSHVGSELTSYLPKYSWAKDNNILTGHDYLLHWIACLIREPFKHLPYLFLWGSQNCGKSTFHEAISLLMTKGVVHANDALLNLSGFNGQLESAILCILEEIDLTKSSKEIYNKIKNWTMCSEIEIHPKHKQVYQIPNKTHWVQCSNHRSYCPIFPDDTRITVLHVPDLNKNTEIEHDTLFCKLQEEAPYFLATLFNLTLPQVKHRMRLPIVETDDKLKIIEANQGVLQTFINDRCDLVPGYTVALSDFYEEFITSVPFSDKANWPKEKMVAELPSNCEVGDFENKKQISNMAFKSKTKFETRNPLKLVNGALTWQ